MAMPDLWGNGEASISEVIDIERENARLTKRIQQFEASYSQVSKALCGTENATLEEVLKAADQVRLRTFSLPCFRGSGKTLALQLSQRIAELEKKLEAAQRERDAAVADLSFGVIKCDVCKHGRFFGNDCIGLFGDGGCSFEWRGVCPENTEVQE